MKQGKEERSGWHQVCVTYGDEEARSLEIRMGTDLLALVGSLSSLSPGNCLRCTKLRLTFSPDEYESVCSTQEKKVRMFLSANSRTPRQPQEAAPSLWRQLQASGGKDGVLVSLQVCQPHALSLAGLPQCAHPPCAFQLDSMLFSKLTLRSLYFLVASAVGP